jgi:2-polyprenyl-3-methyl-5-hydroxy-6-metoxy-1,4-benzoquinol methylase
LKISGLYNRWWYYSIELLPNIVTRGIYANDLPMLPRIMLRRCKLEGISCLDLGSMEGLIPVLMCRGGAKEVLATDAVDFCIDKMEAVKHYYNVNFDFKIVGSMYGLSDKLDGRSFDLINCSGLLYHVFSPLMVLAGLRPLLKRNGLIIVSTHIVLEDGFFMEFNNSGKMESEANTFWYMSIGLLDYLLRYLKLAPVDCVYYPYGKRFGYASVVCRATDMILPTEDDKWMRQSARSSWEYNGVSNWELARHQPVSEIEVERQTNRHLYRDDIKCLDLLRAVKESEPIISAKSESESHVLRLAHVK